MKEVLGVDFDENDPSYFKDLLIDDYDALPSSNQAELKRKLML
jgi:hypothetical protein